MRKVLFGEGKIKFARLSRASNGREGQKMSKILTLESISEPTRFDQSVSRTRKIFQFIDFFKNFLDFKFTPNSSHLGDGINLSNIK